MKRIAFEVIIEEDDTGFTTWSVDTIEDHVILLTGTTLAFGHASLPITAVRMIEEQMETICGETFQQTK